MDDLFAIGRARKLIGGIAAAPVDVAALIAAHNMLLRESDKLAQGLAGTTFTKDGVVHIVVNSHDDPYRRRFTALHELGHHLLQLPSRHGEVLPADEMERFAGRPVEEKLCDVFAAECLVPYHLISPIVSDQPFTIDLLFELSERFQASKPCIASSYVRNSTALVAYVYAENGRTQRILPSATLRSAKIFIDDGLLPSTSAAHAAMTSSLMRAEADVDASDWSRSDAAIDYACSEQALFMPAWGQTHSLLTFERLSRRDGSTTEVDEDDELLAPLTGELTFKRR